MRLPRFRPRQVLFGAAVAAAVAVTTQGLATPVPPAPTMTVYKSPTCGCCSKWVDHMRAAGFKVVVQDLDDLSDIKRTAGVPADLESCHTAIVGAYTIEGHVPAADVQKLLATKPKGIAGLSAPGMPQGSPGMETGVKDRYDVVTFDRAGKTTVFAKH